MNITCFDFLSAVVAGLVQRRTVIALAFVPVFASVAFAQSAAPKKQVKKDDARCIGVVSAIGDTLVVTKTRLLFQSGMRLDGLGLHSRGGEYFAHVEFTVNLHDGQNFSLLAKHPATTGQKNFLGVDKKPYQEVNETWWPAAGGTLSAVARDGFRSLVGQSLEATVPKILNN